MNCPKCGNIIGTAQIICDMCGHIQGVTVDEPVAPVQKSSFSGAFTQPTQGISGEPDPMGESEFPAFDAPPPMQATPSQGQPAAPSKPTEPSPQQTSVTEAYQVDSAPGPRQAAEAPQKAPGSGTKKLLIIAGGIALLLLMGVIALTGLYFSGFFTDSGAKAAQSLMGEPLPAGYSAINIPLDKSKGGITNYILLTNPADGTVIISADSVISEEDFSRIMSQEFDELIGGLLNPALNQLKLTGNITPLEQEVITLPNTTATSLRLEFENASGAKQPCILIPLRYPGNRLVFFFMLNTQATTTASSEFVFLEGKAVQIITNSALVTNLQ